MWGNKAKGENTQVPGTWVVSYREKNYVKVWSSCWIFTALRNCTQGYPESESGETQRNGKLSRSGPGLCFLLYWVQRSEEERAESWGPGAFWYPPNLLHQTGPPYRYPLFSARLRMNVPLTVLFLSTFGSSPPPTSTINSEQTVKVSRLPRKDLIRNTQTKWPGGCRNYAGKRNTVMTQENSPLRNKRRRCQPTTESTF